MGISSMNGGFSIAPFDFRIAPFDYRRVGDTTDVHFVRKPETIDNLRKESSVAWSPQQSLTAHRRNIYIYSLA